MSITGSGRCRSGVGWLSGAALAVSGILAISATAEAQVSSPGPIMVYTTSNAAANQVLIFQQQAGSLVQLGSVNTGGSGNGKGVPFLESQGSLRGTDDGKFLLAVNAGSNQISSFVINQDGTLTLASVVPSNGSLPVSIAAKGSFVYVLNAGCPDSVGPVTSPGCGAGTVAANITGFTINAAGVLNPISGSTQPLSASNPSPADIRFTSDGLALIVSEKGTNKIDLYSVSASTGLAGAPTTVASNGNVPFGLAIGRGEYLLAAESFGTGVETRSGTAGAVSSYLISEPPRTPGLQVITGSLSTNQNGVGPCWVIVTPNGKFVYAGNLGGGDITGYSFDALGNLARLSSTGLTADSGVNSILTDLSIDPSGSNLYALGAGDGTNQGKIFGYTIGADGSLTASVTGNVPSTSVGMVALSPPSPLVAAVLPASRSVQLGNTATAFATIMNSGSTDLTACSIGLPGTLPVVFNYQTTDSKTNAVTGTPNTPANIAAGKFQTYVVGLTPTAAFSPTQQSFNFSCANTASAPVQVGVNTLLISASTTPVPDVIALAATTQNDGILHIIGTSGASAFAVATDNIGASTTITASANTGAVNLPITLTICATDASTGQCLAPPSSSVSVTANNGSTPTFAIFGQATGAIPFNPAQSRIFVQFTDAGGTIRGATDVAVQTQ